MVDLKDKIVIDCKDGLAGPIAVKWFRESLDALERVGYQSGEKDARVQIDAEIKARGEEVLELIINHIGGMAIAPVLKDAIIMSVRLAYREKYGGK